MTVQFTPAEPEAPPVKEEAPVAVNDEGASKTSGGVETNTTRGIDAQSSTGESVAAPAEQETRSGSSRKRQHRVHDPSFRSTSKATVMSDATREYLSMIAANPALTLAEIRDGVIRHINNAIAVESRLRHKAVANAPAIGTIESLDEISVVRVMLDRFPITNVDLTEGAGSEDLALLAMYQSSGPDEGTYQDAEKPLVQMISDLRPTSSARSIQSILALLSAHAPTVRRTIEPNLVPVNNGVFDHARQILLPFSPDLVFLAKSHVDYDPNAESPVITMPDGIPWDFDSWFASLSDDEGVPELLWEIVSATLRSSVPWHKTALLAGPEGNGGKGTIVQLLRNLVGERACSSVEIVKFGDKFGKSALLQSSVNLVDENQVGAFATNVSDWKAVITGDVFELERKYKNPVAMRWRGFEVQCLNTMTPRMKDKSASLKRRLLIVPMTKSFEGIERKYIKNDYLGRDDVLRYVMRRALQMQHMQLSEPVACRLALDEWYRANNKVVDFWQEFEGEFVWDLLPYSFLYDLFVAWSRRREPSGTPEGYRTFLAELKTYLGRSEDWDVPDGSVRPKTMMSASEPLIGIWDLKEWQNSLYSGNDPHALGAFDRLAANYKGAVRRVPIGAGNSAVSPAEEPAES